MTKRLLPCVLLLAALAGFPSGATATHTPCDGDFHVEHFSDDHASLAGIDFAGPGEGWAVGFDHASEESSRARPYAVRFDGDSFEVVHDLGPERGDVYLNDVSALSPDDVFVAGRHGRRRWRTLVLHWDGGEWTRMVTPQPGRERNLLGIFTLAEDDVWAVGNLARRGYVGHVLVLHFDGERWSRADLPPAGPYFPELNDVGASGPDDVWAVGTGGKGGARGIVLRFDGARWRRVPLPRALRQRRAELEGIEVVSPDDVWVVGRGPGPGSRALALHWFGARWERAQLPNVRGAEHLETVAVRGPDDVWALGWRSQREAFSSYAAHWDGSAWTAASSDNSGDLGEFRDARADGAAVWAAVEESDHGWVIERACGTP